MLNDLNLNGKDVRFSPKDGFLVTHATYFNDTQNEYLIYLYQPILGPIATAMFNTLKTLEDPTLTRFQRPMHRILLDMLNVDLPEIEASRRRLEALGLLRTYVGEDRAGKYFVYELYAPLAPNLFFEDDLMSLLLLETVGERQFDKIKQHFRLHPVKKTDLKEISTKFLDIFPETVKRAVTPSTQISETKQAFAQEIQNKPVFSPSTMDTFDWDLLKDLVAKMGIPRTEITKNQQVLFELHRFYSIDEVTMSNLVAHTVDITTNKINTHKLESLVLSEYTRTIGSQSTISLGKSPQGIIRNTSEAETVAQAKKLSPFQFLSWLKRGEGFVGNAETRAVRDLVDRNIFPDPIINMIIYANLSQPNSHTVTQGFIESVGNDWVKQKIDTPEAALEYLKKRQSTSTVSNNKQTYKGKPSTRRQRPATPIPDWYREREAKNQVDSNIQKPSTIKKHPNANTEPQKTRPDIAQLLKDLDHLQDRGEHK